MNKKHVQKVKNKTTKTGMKRSKKVKENQNSIDVTIASDDGTGKIE